MNNFNNINSLSDVQLLSMILGGKNSLTKSEYILNNLTIDKILETGPDELKNVYNLTNSQALNIECFKSLRKRALIKQDLKQIRSSADVKDLLLPCFIDITHEEFYYVFLNRANKVIKLGKLSKGGLSGTVTDIRLLYKKAVLNSASGIIVAHNHPSGNLNPSESDIRITKKIKEAGSLLDIQLLDHLIMYDSDYYSFADNGVL